MLVRRDSTKRSRQKVISLISPNAPREKKNTDTRENMCTPVCAALGYLPQAEFDEEVARKDAQVVRVHLDYFLYFPFFFASERSGKQSPRATNAGRFTRDDEKTISTCRAIKETNRSDTSSRGCSRFFF